MLHVTVPHHANPSPRSEEDPLNEEDGPTLVMYMHHLQRGGEEQKTQRANVAVTFAVISALN